MISARPHEEHHPRAGGDPRKWQPSTHWKLAWMAAIAAMTGGQQMRELTSGGSADDVLDVYPQPTREDIRAVMSYGVE